MDGSEHGGSRCAAAEESGWAIPGVTPGLGGDEPDGAIKPPPDADGTAASRGNGGGAGANGTAAGGAAAGGAAGGGADRDAAEVAAARLAAALAAVTAAAADGDGHDLPVGLTAAVTGVATATAGLERAWAVSETLLTDCLLVTEYLARRVAACRLALLRAVVSRAPAGTPHPPAGARRLLEDACHLSPSRTSQDIANAHLVDPETGPLRRLGAALAAGDVTPEHVDVARRCVRKLPATVVRDHGDLIDDLLTEHARRYHPKATRALADYLLDALGIERSTAGKDPGRHLSLTHTGGVTHLSGQLDEATGRHLEALLDTLITSNRKASGGSQPDDPTTHDSDRDADGDRDRDRDRDGAARTHPDPAGAPEKADIGHPVRDRADPDRAADPGRADPGRAGVGHADPGVRDRDESPDGSRQDVFGIPDLRTKGEQRADAFAEIIDLAANHLALVRDPDTGEPATTGPGGHVNRKPSQAVPRLILHLRQDENPEPDADCPDGGESAPGSCASCDRSAAETPPDRTTPAGGVHRPAPHRDSAQTDTATGRSGSPPGPAAPVGDQSRWARFWATTQDMHRFPPRLTDRETCDALIDLARLDQRGRLISLTSIGRLANDRLTTAVVARDRCCVFPGCTRPPAMCHVHHVLWHRHGGPTDIENLALLCGPHHRLIHAQPRDERDRWQMAMIDGIPHVQPPLRLTPSTLDEPPWLRNTYPLDLAHTRRTAQQLTLTLDRL